jgi:uncharacterized membrane protein required for colicin V production
VVLVAIFVLRAVLEPEDQAFMQESRLMPHLAVVEQWAQETFADARIEAELPWSAGK